MKAIIVNYGMGNINSVVNAFKFLGVDCKLSDKAEEIKNYPMVILPGVGSFKQAMSNLKKLKLIDELKNLALIKKRKILGICLGMQLLGESSTEDGHNKGLEIVKNKVTKFEFNKENILRVPHVGFNNIIDLSKNFPLFEEVNINDNFYFVHSYKMNLEKNKKYALCSYGSKFLAAFQDDNIFGVQFHPEKSQSSGLKVLSNFIKY